MIELVVEDLCEFAGVFARYGRDPFFAGEVISEGKHVWGWFKDLLETRQTGMADNPITFLEIDAYQRLTETRMRPWEVKAIVKMYWSYRMATTKSKTSVGTGSEEVRSITGSVSKKTVVRKRST